MAMTLQANLADVHRHIVESACLAPSAENIQPWTFSAGGRTLIISYDTSQSLASDIGHMLGLTGVGACLENAVIAAREEEFEPKVDYVSKSIGFDHLEGELPVAALQLSDAGQPDSLYSQLADRCTSRRMESRSIDQPILDELALETNAFSRVQLDWVTDPGKMRELGRLVGMGNRVRFEHKPFHQEFYHNVRFTPHEVESSRDGLDLATLQLPWGVGSILTQLRKWQRMRVANCLGFSRSVARQAEKEICRSGALGVLTVEVADVESFLEGGRALQRVWLATTKAGLGFHPAAALAVFLAHVRQSDGTHLSSRHWQMARNMHERFYRLYPSDRTLQMIFRVGYAQRPTVRSLRKLPLLKTLD